MKIKNVFFTIITSTRKALTARKKNRQINQPLKNLNILIIQLI